MRSSVRKRLYAPRFGSQPSPGQRDEPVRDEAKMSALPLRDEPKTRRGLKKKPFLKVKLPTWNVLNNKVSRENATRWILEPPTSPSTAAETPGGHSQDAVSGAGVFFFSQTSPEKPTNDKEKAKLAVLKTISRMLEENQLIRRRLVALTQPS